jgi:2-polyprenyl-3-methyl-5-hydroxy-6-metoxy-1,4-benzoquinol methylase
MISTKTKSEVSQEYRRKIRNEAEFWDERAEALLSSGRISLWFDLRRGENVTFIPLHELKGAGIRANPSLYKVVYNEMMDRILKVATEKKGKVLDIGCGAGSLSLELARLGMEVDGYDVSPRQIEIAKKLSRESQESKNPCLHGNFGGTNYRVVDLNRAILEPEKYEAVISLGTLHHIQSIEHVIDEIHKSLKPGGKFIFYEYIGYSGLSKIFSMMFKILRLYPRFKNYLTQTPLSPKTSPFEGIAQDEIKKIPADRFSILHRESKFLFLPSLVSGFGIYSLPDFWSVPLVKVLCGIDRALIASGIFEGPFVFVIAQKRFPGATSSPKT